MGFFSLEGLDTVRTPFGCGCLFVHSSPRLGIIPP